MAREAKKKGSEQADREKRRSVVPYWIDCGIDTRLLRSSESYIPRGLLFMFLKSETVALFYSAKAGVSGLLGITALLIRTVPTREKSDAV